jgi:hypothetical protein
MPKREKEDCDHCYYSTGDPDGKGVCADGFSLALFFPFSCSLWIFWLLVVRVSKLWLFAIPVGSSIVGIRHHNMMQTNVHSKKCH